MLILQTESISYNTNITDDRMPNIKTLYITILIKHYIVMVKIKTFMQNKRTTDNCIYLLQHSESNRRQQKQEHV